MENLLLSLKSDLATWLGPRFAPWVADVIFAILCGVGLFLVLFPLLLIIVSKSEPSSPLPTKRRNLKKRPVEPRWSPRKKCRALKACRDGLQELGESQGLASLLQSHLWRPPEEGSLRQRSHQRAPGDRGKAAPAGAHRPCREPVGGAAPAVSPSVSLAPPTEHLPPPASALSPSPPTSGSLRPHSPLSALGPPGPCLPLDGLPPRPRAPPPSPGCPPDSEAHPPPRTTSSGPPPPDSTLPLCDSVALPLGAKPQSSSPHTPATCGLGDSRYPAAALSWWQVAAKALCPSASRQRESQPEHLPRHPPAAPLWGDPTDQQVEAGSLSLLSSDDQHLLEIQVTNRIRIKIWEKEDQSHRKQMSPDDPLTSLGNVLKSLGAEQDAESPRPSWSTAGKPGQRPGPQLLPYPRVSGGRLQLFWGLPCLHSESLVAPAWISEKTPAPQCPPVLFNGIAGACPVQVLAEASPPPAHSQPLCLGAYQSEPLSPTAPRQLQAPSLVQAWPQAHVQSSVPNRPPPPEAGAREAPCRPTARKPLPLIPSESPHPPRPLLQKQRASGRAPSSADGAPQEALGSFTPDLPTAGAVASILPDNFPISPALREQLEQHLQQWFIDHSGSPHGMQKPREPRQLQGESPGAREAQDEHGPSQVSLFTGESSKDAQDGGAIPRQHVGKGPGHILRKVPMDPSSGSESSRVLLHGVDSEESASDLTPLKRDSGNDILRRLGRDLEDLLKSHLDRKLGQISEGWIPLSVRRSWLAVHYVPAKSDAPVTSRNPETVKGRKCQVNTADTVSLLEIDAQEVLATHITRLGARPLRVLRPVNLLRWEKTPPSPPQQASSCPRSAASTSRAHLVAEHAEFLGTPPQAPQREKVIAEEAGHLLGPSPVCEEIQGTLGRTPSGDDHGPSEATVIRQEDRPPSQSFTCSWQDGIVEQAKRGCLHPSSSSAMASNQPVGKSGGQASRDPYGRVATRQKSNLKSQSLRAKEAREAESTGSLGTDVLTLPQNTDPRSLEAPGTSPSPEGSVPRDPGQPGFTVRVANEFKTPQKVESENQPQGFPTCTLLAADTRASHVPWCRCQRAPTGVGAEPRGLCGLMGVQRNSLRQQKLRFSKLQGFGKIRGPAYEREGSGGPSAGEHTERVGQLGTPQAGSTGPSAQAQGAAGSVGRKPHWRLPEKKQDRPGTILNSLKLFLQGIVPRKTNDAPQQPKPKAATALSPGPRNSSSGPACDSAERQAPMTSGGRILEEKVAAHWGHRAPDVNTRKQEPQAPVHRGICYRRTPFCPEPGLRRGQQACSHQANTRDQSCSIREHRRSSKNEQPGLSHFLSLPHKGTQCPASPCRCGPRMPSAPGHHQHCPRHCHLRGGYLYGQQ